MILKKNKVSNLIWIIYAIFALAFSAFVFTKAAQSFGFDAGYGLAAVPVTLGICIGIVFLYRILSGKFIKKISLKPFTAMIITYGISLTLLGIGIWLRINAFGHGQYELGEYFKNSVITDKPMYMTLHGASQFYYYFLRQLFMLFGNHSEAAVIFQIVCQIAGFIALFFGVKRIMGVIPSLSFLTFGMIAPVSVSQCMMLGPSCMFLLFLGLDILILSYTVPFRKNSYILAGVSGALTGIIGYMDLISVIFIVVAIVFFLVDNVDFNKENVAVQNSFGRNNNTKVSKGSAKGNKNANKSNAVKRFISVKVTGLSAAKVSVLQDKTIALIIYFGSWLFLLFICVVIDLAATGLSFSYVVKTQLSFYKPGAFSLFSVYSGVDIISGILLAVLMLIGIMSGLKRERTDQGCFLFGIILVLCIINGFSMLEANMNCYFYILLVASLLGGEAINGLVNSGSNVLVSIKSADEEQEKLLEAEKIAKNKTVHKIEDGEMLDNPLPVPERKQRKKMEYDYFVPEDAEYDI